MVDKTVLGQINPGTGLLQWDFDINDYATFISTGLGTKSAYVYYNDIETMPVGAITAGDTQGLVLSIAGGTSIATDLCHSGTRAYKKDYFNNNDFPKLYLNCPAEHDEAYFSCWFYYETLDLSGVPVWSSGETYALNASVQKNSVRYKSKGAGNINHDPATDYSYTYWDSQTNVWKLGRIGNTAGDPYHANRFAHEMTGTIPTSPSNTMYSEDLGYTSYSGNNEVSYNPLNITANAWHFYEQYATAGSVSGTDASYEVRIDSVPAVRFSSATFRTPVRPDKIRSIMTPINGLDNQWQAGKSNTRMWMDEVYMTTSRKRLVMTDSATYASSTMFCLQKDLENGWTDSLIQYIPIRGSFTQGATAYLHAIDGNTVLATKTITVP